jgi:hypothetical protein
MYGKGSPMIKFIHRYRRNILFACFGMLIGKYIWYLGDEVGLAIFSIMVGMPFGSGITLIYLHKKGLLK